MNGEVLVDDPALRSAAAAAAAAIGLLPAAMLPKLCLTVCCEGRIFFWLLRTSERESRLFWAVPESVDIASSVEGPLEQFKKK